MATRDLGSALQGIAQALASTEAIKLQQALAALQERRKAESRMLLEQQKQQGSMERIEFQEQLRAALRSAIEEQKLGGRIDLEKLRGEGRERLQGMRGSQAMERALEVAQARGASAKELERLKAGEKAKAREDQQAHEKEILDLKSKGKRREAPLTFSQFTSQINQEVGDQVGILTRGLTGRPESAEQAQEARRQAVIAVTRRTFGIDPTEMLEKGKSEEEIYRLLVDARAALAEAVGTDLDLPAGLIPIE